MCIRDRPHSQTGGFFIKLLSIKNQRSLARQRDSVCAQISAKHCIIFRLSTKSVFLILSSFCTAKGFSEHMASSLVCAPKNVKFQWILGHAPEIHYSARPAGRGLFLLKEPSQMAFLTSSKNSPTVHSWGVFNIGSKKTKQSNI